MAWILMEKEGKTFRAGGVSCWAFSHGDMETRGESGELWAEVFYTIALECGSRRVEIDCIAQCSALESGRLHWNWDAVEYADLMVFEDDEETSEYDGGEVFKEFSQKMGGWNVEKMVTTMAAKSLFEEMEKDATELLRDAAEDSECFVDYDVPTWAVPYLVNGDYDNLSDSDIAYCENFEEQVSRRLPGVSVPYEFDPEQIPYFMRPDFGRFDDECVTCRVYY